MAGAATPSNGDGTPGLRPRRLTGDPVVTDEPPRRTLGERASAVLSSVWAAFRPTRNRTTGYVAVGAVGALIGTSAVVGVGAAGAVPDLADIGAWLGSSDKGSAAHANGLTGDVDGKVDLPTGKHPVSISQDGKTVLVLDKKTGKVVRIDPSQLTAEESTEYSSSDLQLVAGGAYAYVINPVEGTVQRIDPVTTGPLGKPVDLGVKPLGEAVVDPKGTLWVPQPTNGKVTPFPQGKKAKPLTVTNGKNHNLVMTLANGEAVVTDTTGATTTMLSVKAAGLKVKLPSFIEQASPEDVLVPGSTDGSVVPVLAAKSGHLALLDTRTANLTNAFLGGGGASEYGAPQVLGSKVYVPDHSNGTLKVYDTAESAIEQPIKVTKEPGELEVFVRNGLLWVNDQDNEAAAVINSNGDVSKIGKYKTDVPSARNPDDTPPVTDNVPDIPDRPAPDPDPPVNPDASTTEKPDKPDRPKPTLTPPDCPEGPSGCLKPKLPPGTPQAQAGTNGVTVTFSPSSGLKPRSYRLTTSVGDDALVPNTQVTPGSVGPDGPFQFRVSGLDCAKEYNFRVTARFADGESTRSQLSAPTRPCTAPAAPRSLRVTPHQGGHGFTITWQAPANASGTMTYTVGYQDGPSQTTTKTSHSVTGLKNGQTYSVSVSSSNEAGGGAAANGTGDLRPRPQTMNIAHNDDDNDPLAIRTQPTTQSGGRAGTIPGNSSPSVTVHCKTRGSSETHPYDNVTSDYWGRITYNGTTGFVADIYLDSRNNGNVWDCS